MTTIQHDDTATTTTTPDPAAAAAAGTAAVATQTATTTEPLITPPVEGAATTTTPAAIADVIPEKYRVMGADGALDLDASARKQADAYKALETKLGNAAELPPKTAAEYKLEAPKDAEGKSKLPEGVDFDGFIADPLTKEFTERAHAKGLTNAQLQFVVEEYLTLTPELMAEQTKLTATEARAELAKLWTDDTALNANLGSVARAIAAFGGKADEMPGSQKRLWEKYGSDPDFIAFAAGVAKEVHEDTPLNPQLASEQDVESLQKSKAYWDVNDPAHAATKAKVDEFYARKHGTAKR